MNGLEMIENIREENFDIPIFIVSAHNDTSFFLESIRLGIDGYLIKPLEAEMFIQQVFKRVQRVYLQKQVKDYQENLEKKVNEQVDEIINRDKALAEQTKLATMGEMIDVIAHQWKQPLGIIDLNLALLIEEYEVFGEEITYDKVKDCKGKVSEQIEHLTSTLDNFRAFFRPNKDVETINIKGLLSSVKNLMKDQLIKNNIFIEENIENNLEVKGNINEIKHIFINLLNNAKDAFIEHNTEKRVIEISSYETQDQIVINVLDNAGGIPEEIIDDIFKANFTTKDEKGGTGIGLYMSDFIAKKNNATLDVENKKDGANFILKFNL